AAAVALGLGEHDVGHDADAEQHEHRSARDLIEKDSAHISQTPHCSFVSRMSPHSALTDCDDGDDGAPCGRSGRSQTAQCRVFSTSAAAEASSSVPSAAICASTWALKSAISAASRPASQPRIGATMAATASAAFLPLSAVS